MLISMILLTGLLVIAVNKLNAQNVTPDSLLTELNQTNNDSTKVLLLREIVNYWKVKECDSTIYYSKMLASKAKEIDHKIFFYKGIYWLTNCYGVQGKYDSSLYYGFQGIDYFQEDSSSYQKIILHMLVGEQYRAMAMFENSILYLNKAWEMALEIELSRVYCSISNRLAAAYYENKQTEQALHWADTSIQLGDKTQNHDYYISNLNIKGSVFTDQKLYAEAIGAFKEAYNYANKNSDSLKIAEISNSLANLYRLNGDLSACIKFALSSFEITSKNNIDALSMVSSETLAHAYAELGDFENAYKFSRIYERLRNEIFFKQRDELVAELNTKYDTDQKEKKIQIQNITLEKKDIQIKQRSIVSVLFLILIILLIIFLIFRQRTNRRLLDLNAKLTKLNEYKQANTSMLVHDLKNPLNLLSNIELIGNDAEKVKIVKRSSKQMLNIVMNMLDVSKYDKDELKLSKSVTDLSSILSKTIEDMRHISANNNVEILNLTETNYYINADKDILSRIITNLLSNAIKFSPNGDIVTVNTIVRDNSKLRVSVKDNGLGISAEYHNTIFEQYTQIAKGGTIVKGSTGLGLAFCKMAVEAHGWNIWLESVVGNGANFIIEIPNHERNYENVTKPAKKTINSKGSSLLIELSKEKRTELNSYICELKNLPINAISEIKTNLKNIRELNDEKLNDWASKVLKAVEAFDEEKYLSLIKYLSDEQL